MRRQHIICTMYNLWQTKFYTITMCTIKTNNNSTEPDDINQTLKTSRLLAIKYLIKTFNITLKAK